MEYQERPQSPEEVILQPSDYDLPASVDRACHKHAEKLKQAVRVTRAQMIFFGERGVPWPEIEKFYNVDQLTLKRYYKTDYDRGYANTNVELRNKMVELALEGNVTMLIWVSKNRLSFADNPEKTDALAVNRLKQLSDDELKIAIKKAAGEIE